MSSPKVDQAITLIKELIRSGDLIKGEKLPKENELADQLGVSRNSLREAVRALQSMKILEARQGDGTYVSNLEPASMMEILNFAVDISEPISISQFLEIREVLELYCVRIAAAKRTTEELEKLKKIHNNSLEETDTEKLMKLDTQFHQAISEIVGNPILTSLLSVVSATTLRARLWRNRVSDSNYTKLRNEHGAVLNYIEQQNVDGSMYAMWSHIEGVKTWVSSNADNFKNGDELC